MNTHRVLVTLATYDEIGRVLPAADLLVVDDNSPDGTGQWCDQRAQKDSRLKCIHRAGKQGLGSATIAAVQYAIDGSYDVFISMDADWSHDPQHLPALLSALDGADVALGSRYCPGGAIDGWPLHRRVLSRAANGLTGLLLRLPVRDASGAFRAYRISALKKIDLSIIRGTGYAYLEEILWHLHRARATMVDVPITFRERRAGRSKINAKEAVSKL